MEQLHQGYWDGGILMKMFIIIMKWPFAVYWNIYFMSVSSRKKKKKSTRWHRKMVKGYVTDSFYTSTSSICTLKSNILIHLKTSFCLIMHRLLSHYIMVMFHPQIKVPNFIYLGSGFSWHSLGNSWGSFTWSGYLGFSAFVEINFFFLFQDQTQPALQK